MTDFYTSDLHLGHARIVELAHRPFSSVEEMDETIIARWNATVADEDEVLILGDLAMGTLVDSLAKVATLRGHKYLVPGNHDRVSSQYGGTPAQRSRWRAMYKDVGLTILPEQIMVSIDYLAMAVACHYPYDDVARHDDRFADALPKDEGWWLLHGHTHARERVRGRQIHVGVDAWDFTPVSDAQVAELIKTSKHVPVV